MAPQTRGCGIRRKWHGPLPVLVIAAACFGLWCTQDVAFGLPRQPLTMRVVTQTGTSPSQAGVAGAAEQLRLPTKPVPHILFTQGGEVSARWPPVVVAACAAVVLQAASSKESQSGKAQTDGLWESVKLPVYAALWYFFNIQYNIVNKQLLKVFPAIWAVAWLQLAAGIPIAAMMWASGLLKVPKLSTAELVKLLPVGAFHAAGQILTVASLGAVAVSFTHTVKALEPAVNAMASAVFLGQVFHPLVYASLLPVFAGVAMASAGEMSFTMFGFSTAMLSNVAFVMRNVLSTKFGSIGDMGEDKTTRKTNQLSVLTIAAAVVLLPVALLIPNGLLSIPDAWRHALSCGLPARRLVVMIAASGFHFFMYQMSSFWVLSCVQPITHSVLNTLKRIVIIIVSVIVFQNPVSLLSGSGTLVAIGGVLLYSLTKARFKSK